MPFDLHSAANEKTPPQNLQFLSNECIFQGDTDTFFVY